MIEVVDTVYSPLSYADVIKHQALHKTVLRAPEDLLLARDDGDGHEVVLES